MIIRETERSTYLDVSKIEWEPTKYPGVSVKMLYRDASGKRTTLARMAPGARLPDHRHTGVHSAWSPDGCIVLGIFDAPNQFLE